MNSEDDFNFPHEDEVFLDDETTRLQKLEKEWTLFEETDEKIRNLPSPNLEHSYFAKEYYHEIAELYLQYKQEFLQRIADLDKKQARSKSPNPTTSREAREIGGALPKMPKPQETTKNPDVNRLIRRQAAAIASLNRLLTRIDSDLQQPQRQQYFQNMKDAINELWFQIKDCHQDIWELAHDPVAEGYNLEEYIDLEDNVHQKLITLVTHQDPLPQQPTVSQGHNNISVMKLPKIVLPKFEGDYLKWRQFCDIFTELVHNQSIAECQKMWYLKTSVAGEAEKLIRHLTVSDMNYKAAWKIICDRYENKRLLTTSFLNKFLSQPAFASESTTSIKNLHDTTQECLLGLQNLGIDITTWDPLILHILLKKIDKGTHALYEQSLNNPRNLPSLKDFLAFLETRFQSMEALGNKSRPLEEHPKRSVNSITSSESICSVCNNQHQLYACSKFLQLSPSKRLEHVKRANLCVKCLKKGHKIYNCPARTCTKCNKKHNTLLHIDVCQNIKPVQNPQLISGKREEVTSTERNISLAARQTEGNETHVLLGTAMVTIVGNHGKSVTCRALLDSGSQLNLVSEQLAKKLSLPERTKKIAIEGIGEQQQLSAKMVNISVKSHINNFFVQVEAHVLPQIVSQQPAREFKINSWPIPKNIVLADDRFNEPATIDLLLGAGVYYTLLSVGQIRLGKGLPILQNTRLGWIVAGATNQEPPDSVVCGICSEDEALESQIERFWSLEEKEEATTTLTADEQKCETFFTQTTKKDSDGRFIVNLPFSDHPHTLGDSSGMAYQRLLSLEKRMTRDQAFRTLYTQFMEEYIRLGHMEEVNINDLEPPYCFLPHHGVLKPESSTTKLRVVFDASARTSSGKSLNDILSKGPVIQDDVFSILLRFRMPRYVFTSDIEKMYRQIWIDKADRKYQLIWWREHPNQQARCYQLCTVTYGTTSAPYLAIRCLKRLADEYARTHPLGAIILKRDFYVDEVLAGANTIAEAVESQKQLNTILQKTGLRLRKWCANHPSLLEGIPNEDREVEIRFGNDEAGHIKTIGLSWNPATDNCHIRTAMNDSKRITKRTILSDIAHLFDPLGIITPVIVTAKIFLQTLWAQKLDWDAALPQEMHTFWETYRSQLTTLNEIKFPRHVLAHKTAKTIQFHIFSDASEKAYGAAAYVRVIDRNNIVTAHLLCAKSKVAPRKQTTLPRLELCAAKVAAELAHRIKRDLQLQDEQIHLWSDSTIVLSWINSSTSTFHTFVANRVSRIQELTIRSQWRHVNTVHNPADILSRGLTPAKLVTSTLWFYGPIFLHGKESQWPAPYLNSDTSYAAEKRQTVITTAITTREFIITQIDHRNSFQRLQRIMANIIRFTKRCKKCLVEADSWHCSTHELDEAKKVIISQMQREKFDEDIRHIKKYGEAAKTSSMSVLCPWIDEDGLLRVGGRLQASSLQYEAKHQLLLPYDHPLTKLIISDIHRRNHHVGPQTLLATVRQQYWPIKGKTLTRSVVDHCIQCTRAKPKLYTQMMGNLPPHRVQPARPFVNSGVDFCGPVWTHFRIRGKRPQKNYIAVFCCFATKAVHLEIVTDLSAQGFIGALKRFIGRRGHCKTIFCDNATNFVGAKFQLQEIQQMLESNHSKDHIITEGTNLGIEFKFIPPRAPHFGGLWEAAVKSAKHLLQHTLTSANLTYEELETVVIEVEAILNSRPITAMSSNPNDLTALTPGHFLIGEPLLNPVDPQAEPLNMNLPTRWKLIMHIKNEFWRRWSMEYLNQLQCRYKWRQRCDNAEKGTLVIMKDDNLPPLKWQLGRIVDVIKGKDGLVRVADVQTQKGILRRPIHKLAPLPVETTSSPSESKAKDANTTTALPKEDHDGDGPSSSQMHSPNTRKRQKMSTSSAVTALFLACLILPLQQITASPVEIKPFDSQPGIFFEGLGPTSLITSEWQVIAFYNMTPFWNECSSLTTYYNLLEDLCKRLIEHNGCSRILANLQHIVSELEENNNLLTTTVEAGRSKRGALNVVGSVANALFGVLDADYAEKMSETLKSLNKNEDHLSHLIANQTSILDSTINVIRRDQEAVNKQLQEWSAHINRITSEISTVHQELSQQTISNAFSLMAMQTYIISSNIQRIQGTILDVLTDTHHGKLNPLLITADQLRKELKQIRNNLPPSLRLPVAQDDILQYYSIISIQGRPTRDHIIFRINIPLIAIEEFEVLKVVPVPIQHNHTSIAIQVSSPFIISNLHRDEYSLLQDLQPCVLLIGERYLCKQAKPLYRRTSNNSICEIELLNHLPHPPICQVTTTDLPPHWIPLHDPNKWVYVMKEVTTINVVCKDKVHQIKLEGSGVLRLSEDCIIKQEQLKIRSHTTTYSVKTIEYLPRINLTPSDPIHTSLVSEVHSGYQPQLADLDALKNQLNQLRKATTWDMEPHETHQFTVSYVSLILVGAILSWIILQYYRTKRTTIHHQYTEKPIPKPRTSMHKENDGSSFEIDPELAN